MFKSKTILNHCLDCTEYSDCTFTECEYMPELKKGERYGRIVNQLFTNSEWWRIRDRLNRHIRKFKGTWFLNQKHEERFLDVYRQQEVMYGDGLNRYLAAVFIITSNNNLWQLMKDNIYLNGIIFDKEKIIDIGVDAYALFKVAKKIWYEEKYQEFSELGDDKLITDNTFDAIVKAKLIAKYGWMITKFKLVR